MRKLFGIFILTLWIAASSFSSVAQNKLGHIDTSELLRSMPGREAAQAELEKYAKELEAQYTMMQEELQKKYQDYVGNAESFSDLIRQSKERELESLQARIREFEQSAQEDLVRKESSLLNPIIEQARKAIQDVAKEQGYSYVFDSSGGTILYAEPTDDLMEEVKKKLGL